jgi:hypothetical protein
MPKRKERVRLGALDKYRSSSYQTNMHRQAILKKASRLQKKRRHTGGTPKFVPTEEQRLAVRTMAGFGIPQDRIRMAIISPRTKRPISQSTLRIVFADELAAGGAEMDEVVTRSHRKLIEERNVAAIVWYQKNRWGWRDRADHAHAHLMADRNPDQSEVQVVVSFLSAEGKPTRLSLDDFAAHQAQRPEPRPAPPMIEDMRPASVATRKESREETRARLQAELEANEREIARLRTVAEERGYVMDLPPSSDWPGRTR